jgi:hypothetical protein
MDREAFK